MLRTNPSPQVRNELVFIDNGHVRLAPGDLYVPAHDLDREPIRLPGRQTHGFGPGHPRYNYLQSHEAHNQPNRNGSGSDWARVGGQDYWDEERAMIELYGGTLLKSFEYPLPCSPSHPLTYPERFLLGRFDPEAHPSLTGFSHPFTPQRPLHPHPHPTMCSSIWERMSRRPKVQPSGPPRIPPRTTVRVNGAIGPRLQYPSPELTAVSIGVSVEGETG